MIETASTNPTIARTRRAIAATRIAAIHETSCWRQSQSKKSSPPDSGALFSVAQSTLVLSAILQSCWPALPKGLIRIFRKYFSAAKAGKLSAPRLAR
jgi:hypothetical protein